MVPFKTSLRCPICKKLAVEKFRPFCSERCKLIDLGHWLKGTYVIPSDTRCQTSDVSEGSGSSDI